jgi:hypothetical protein
MAPSPTSDKPATTRVLALIETLVDEGGLVLYVDEYFKSDPRIGTPEQWDDLRRRLWSDCHDGDRYYWQPSADYLRELYELQRSRATA